MDFRHEDTGETWLSVGGSWNRRFRDYDGEADQAVMVRFHEGQAAAVAWFARWLDAHEDRRENPPKLTAADLDNFKLDLADDHVYSALFAGGRRGGKTWIAVALAIAYAIMFPKSIVWIVSPNDQKHDEIRRYLHDFIARVWLDRQTAWDYELINGSVISLRGAHGVGSGLKEGKANLVILNEGQMMNVRAFTIARGAIVDQSGLVLVCANPPVEEKDQIWVTDFATDAAAGRRAAVFLEFNPLQNPHIDRAALLSLQAEVDERTFDIEVLGLFRGPKDAVAYNWIRMYNERRAPHPSLDCTSIMLSLLEEGDGITDVAGVDFQRVPHIGGPIYRFFGDPHRDRVLAHIVDEVVLEGGDEDDYCWTLKQKGYHPDRLLIVGDASGRYQNTRRTRVDQQQPNERGGGSFAMIQSNGYRRIVPPARRMLSNPLIQDRVRAFTSMICSKAGNRRLFADPDRAPKTCHSIRDWRSIHGKPDRIREPAHLGDGASYPIVRLFPRKLRSDKTDPVDPVVALVDQIPAMADQSTRIMPPTFGPAFSRRGSRTRGM